MKRIKSVEVVRFRGERYLRVWQYAARGGKSMSYQVRIADGQKSGDALKEAATLEFLEKEFGFKVI